MRIDFQEMKRRVADSERYFAEGLVEEMRQSPLRDMLREFCWRWEVLLQPDSKYWCPCGAYGSSTIGIDLNARVSEMGSLRESMKLVTTGMRSLGFRRSREHKAKLEDGRCFVSYWTHAGLNDLGFASTACISIDIPTESELSAAAAGRVGAQCRRVQVDVEKRLVEVPVYKIVCFDEVTGQPVPISKVM